MGKNKDESRSGRREPYNQPIKIYGGAFRRYNDEADIGLRVAWEVIRAREAMKMTQADLARVLKTKQRTIARIESGAGDVTVVMLDRIARALRCRLKIRIEGPNKTGEVEHGKT